MNLVEPHIAGLLGLPPALPLCLTVAFIVFLFRRDIREKPNISSALWLPTLWLLLACSRPPSAWLNVLGLPAGGSASGEEGSPVDVFFRLGLTIAGLCVLSKRQVQLSEIVRNNGWLIAFFLYCFISVAWSDIPLTAFKQWTKIFGHPIMALIVLTEPDLEEALTRLMKRCAYVVVPVSILWIKYYPQYGRAFDDWGLATNTGVTTGKNVLGSVCLTLGFFFFWHLLQTWRTERSTQRRTELRLMGGFLIGILWLLRQAHSANPTIGLFLAMLIVVFVGIRSTIKNFIGTYMLAALVLFAVAELTFGVSGHLSENLGRGTNLTGRTDLWAHCLEVDSNPILGAGFESFWLGQGRTRIGAFYGNWQPGGAHNDYLDTYLNLGLVGLSILLGLLIATFWKIRLELFRNFEWGRYRLGFFAAILLHAATERTFGSYGPLCFVFYIIALDYPPTYLTMVDRSVGVSRSEESWEFAYAEAEP